ncbi:DUF294 nucleotidyltransferase-like domain-containing protein [Alteribacillus sp. HJP-4]|uniref:DUF294 nucleotidyltransferase-like domain-containing protein n=1 Tax=Alteribacillus sp. HJP-4 TaxID=2775394 RepID=UPI0035CD2C19
MKPLSSRSGENEETFPDPSFSSYEEIKQKREQEMKGAADNTEKLNDAHDRWILESAALALQITESERGKAPAHFAFFLMGSAGRQEQAIWSDQDHGIIFEGSDAEYQSYFLKLGEEIREGMAHVGYPRCEGKVMASHPRWCHGVEDWKQQIDDWIEKDKWETLRHLLTFIDARALAGKASLLKSLKDHVFQHADKEPVLLKRLSENTSYLHRGTNAFGKLLPEEKGPYTGYIHIKDVGLFPYVHAARLLAIKEQIYSVSTSERLGQLETAHPYLKGKVAAFQKLLELRSSFTNTQESYEDVHYIPVNKLSKTEKNELKHALKEGKHLFQQTKKLAESGEK